MKTRQTLRVHNAMVIARMQSSLNQLRAGKKLGRKPRLGVLEDRNALALHYIESGRIRRFAATHKIVVGTALMA
jgi:hypothetical protein